jgi:predicted transcriptional regulator
METILNMARDLILAQVRQGAIDSETITDWLRTTHGTLLSLWLAEHQPAVTVPPPSRAIDWRRSIREKYITCMICGGRFRQLGGRHLHTHGLTPDTYREQFNIPRAQPLSARELTAQRRQTMLNVKPWQSVAIGSNETAEPLL